LIVLTIVIGFPIALVMAWAFELTPEGLKRTEDVDPFDSGSGQFLATEKPRGRVWIYVVVVAATISIGLFFLGRYSAPRNVGESTTLSAKSIAVLPFQNLSKDEENAFFADGVQDEILTDLAKIADLKVISRTSV